MAIRVEKVENGSPAEKLEITPGSILLSIDGNELNDMLDYQFYTANPRFQLAVSQNGVLRYLDVEKDQYTPFGCDFKTYLGDQKHSCDNHCMFCFVEQLPKGMRESLYFKDDDERLSFLFGNYITLTNMSERELERIIRMHISPINISVHTTNPELRIRMMANKRGGETLDYLQKFAKAGIRMNCQFVLCRGINDGAELRRSLNDLLALAPHVNSIAAVPAGLTRYRDHLFKLEPYDAKSAGETLDILEEYGQKCLEQFGERLVYPSDEWYLLTGRPIPNSDFYEEFAQLENGVGMWRQYHDHFDEALEQSAGLVLPRSIDVVTGELAAPLIKTMTRKLHRKYRQVNVYVHPIQNNYFGGNVTVAGLVTGTDILAQCKGKLQSGILGIPEVMLREEKDMFLDNVTPAQLEKELGVRVEILPNDGADCCKALLGGRSLSELLRSLKKRKKEG